MSSTWSCGACARKLTIRSRKNSSRRFAALVMFSKRTEARSIASQLVLLFTLCATLLLSCGLGIFYWIVVRHAFEEDNEVLADKITAVRNELKQTDGINTLDRELKNRRSGESTVYWVRVLDPAENLLTETPGMNELLPSRLFPSAARSTSPNSNKSFEVGSRLFSLVAATETVDGRP